MILICRQLFYPCEKFHVAFGNAECGGRVSAALPKKYRQAVAPHFSLLVCEAIRFELSSIRLYESFITNFAFSTVPLELDGDERTSARRRFKLRTVRFSELIPEFQTVLAKEAGVHQ